jgi:hypothetical protein
MGKEVKSAQGEDVGKIKDIVFKPQTGEMFVLVGLGRNRLAPVPWQLLNIGPTQNEKTVVVSLTKEVVNSAPSVTEEQWASFNDPRFTSRIYSYFGVQPTAAGATGRAAGSESGAEQQPQAPPSPNQKNR